MNIESLPNPFIVKIFNYLDPKSLCKVAQVCQKFFLLSALDSSWGPLLQEKGIQFQKGQAKQTFVNLILGRDEIAEEKMTAEKVMADYRCKRLKLDEAIENKDFVAINEALDGIGESDIHRGEWDDPIENIVLLREDNISNELLEKAIRILRPSSIFLRQTLLKLDCTEELAILYLNHCYIEPSVDRHHSNRLQMDLKWFAFRHSYSKFMQAILAKFPVQKSSYWIMVFDNQLMQYNLST